MCDRAFRTSFRFAAVHTLKILHQNSLRASAKTSAPSALKKKDKIHGSVENSTKSKSKL